MPLNPSGKLSLRTNLQSSRTGSHALLDDGLGSLDNIINNQKVKTTGDRQVVENTKKNFPTPNLIRTALRCQRKVSYQTGPKNCLTRLINGSATLIRSENGHVSYNGLLRCNLNGCVHCRHIRLNNHRDDLQEILNIAAVGKLKVLYTVNTMKIASNFDVSEGIDTVLKALSLTFHHQFRKKIKCIARISSIEIVYSDKTSRGWNVHANSLLFFAEETKLPNDINKVIVDRYIKRVESIDKKRLPALHGQFFKMLDPEDYSKIGNYITKSNSKWNVSNEMLSAPYKRVGGMDLTDLVIAAADKGGIYLKKYHELVMGMKGRRLYNKTPNIREILLGELDQKLKDQFDLEDQEDEPEIIGQFSGRLWTILISLQLEWRVIDIFNCKDAFILQECILLLMQASNYHDVSYDELKLMTREIFTSKKYKLIQNQC